MGLDQALEELQARRRHELSKVYGEHDTATGAAWIQGSDGGAAAGKHIKIGDEAPLEDSNIQIITEEKRVRFSEASKSEASKSEASKSEASKSDNATDFLEKLKTTKSQTQSIQYQRKRKT